MLCVLSFFLVGAVTSRKSEVGVGVTTNDDKPALTRTIDAIAEVPADSAIQVESTAETKMMGCNVDSGMVIISKQFCANEGGVCDGAYTDDSSNMAMFLFNHLPRKFSAAAANYGQTTCCCNILTAFNGLKAKGNFASAVDEADRAVAALDEKIVEKRAALASMAAGQEESIKAMVKAELQAAFDAAISDLHGQLDEKTAQLDEIAKVKDASVSQIALLKEQLSREILAATEARKKAEADLASVESDLARSEDTVSSQSALLLKILEAKAWKKSVLEDLASQISQFQALAVQISSQADWERA